MDYLRPQLVRSYWQALDGEWDFSFSESVAPHEITWQGKIQVPYPPESALSGVGDTSYHPVIWYKRKFTIPDSWKDQRVQLHFGAVDWSAQIWINDHYAIRHEGGHTPFSVEITDLLQADEQTIVLRAEDDPTDLGKPRGKQDWQETPHHIWYPRTSGIWQPVWLEPVHSTHITKLRLTPNLTQFGVLIDIQIANPSNDLRAEVTLRKGNALLSSDSFSFTGAQAKRFVHLPDPGIYDARNPYLWSPERPNLIDIDIRVLRGETVIDEIQSYTALRSVEARDGAFYLNGRPYFLRLALDQGYWDESLLAAPNSDALKKDVELVKAMGFNGVRKHQKIEDPRYLYWADKLGLLVWEELPSAYSFSPKMVGRLTREWLEVIERDYNHPCIVAWVCFNESWGVPDLPSSEAQRNFVAGLYYLTKSLDPSRPVVGNDGWEHVVTDLLTIHDYSRAPATLTERYGTPEAATKTSQKWLEHGRTIVLRDARVKEEPKILSEFGGIRFHSEREGWGYQQVEDANALLDLYANMVKAVSGSGLAGFCYTQFADTFQEQNGLLYSDRRPKVALEALAKATKGGG